MKAEISAKENFGINFSPLQPTNNEALKDVSRFWLLNLLGCKKYSNHVDPNHSSLHWPTNPLPHTHTHNIIWAEHELLDGYKIVKIFV